MAHKKRADVFYERLKENADDALTCATLTPELSCFSPTSNVPVKEIPTLSKLLKTSSNQIASAIHKNLSQIADFEGITKICWFSNGRGRQNQNKIVIRMLMHWFLNEAPGTIQEIQTWFPIAGHSFIPPDRLWKIDVIEKPEIYMDIMKKTRNRHPPGRRTVPCSRLEDIEEPGNWHFEFQMAKENIIIKTKNRNACIVQGEPFYNVEFRELKSVNRRRKSFKNRNLPTRQNTVEESLRTLMGRLLKDDILL
ncbi:hypothetical protein PR048_023457 [Dryococelus australis]|uniref:Uncharacterized protein n=1 Tax=Dryococelus australis TaxID=614101 RepID=A0ABQ9GU39_9NEOP|nr:hypothetical protein PR048_023457 [Dryococelus australis]